MKRPEDLLAEIVAEVRRVDTLRELVARAGYVPSDTEWVYRRDVTAAVAALDDVHVTTYALAQELRRLLLADGWRERRMAGGVMWRARLVKRRKR